MSAHMERMKVLEEMVANMQPNTLSGRALDLQNALVALHGKVTLTQRNERRHSFMKSTRLPAEFVEKLSDKHISYMTSIVEYGKNYIAVGTATDLLRDVQNTDIEQPIIDWLHEFYGV